MSSEKCEAKWLRTPQFEFSTNLAQNACIRILREVGCGEQILKLAFSSSAHALSLHSR